MNDVQKAIKQLSVFQPGVFPRDALQTLIDQQEISAPLLLQYLETVAEDVEKALENEQAELMLFALFLLGQFRETAAYQPLIRMLGRLEDSEDLLGDLVTESLPRIIASVCDGDINPIRALAENPEVDPYVRSAAFYALGTLTFQNVLSVDTLKDYCHSMLAGKLQYDPKEGYLPIALVSLCEMHGFADLLPDIRKAYQRWPEMKRYSQLKHVENKLKSSEPDTLEVTFHKDLITDTIASLETWHCFKPAAKYDDGNLSEYGFEDEDYDLESLLPQLQALQDPLERTFVREMPKVGRNDPCTCGSGKKYKKCCG
ncbi:hypothetical protein DC094_11745 [Pelagibaculum spongiae]|uniref:DUF1186 domain-containing protein n=1 Tax=Pelagibaculum spongiae TaxID=2080658 RepID=A0A2V1GTI6_9GAMM|nr:DUF1186 domain-containing protein [Pelagibaculum spongiae]PVZ68918.1 hypothetical protein DC094_11745 [Pelagibaculum spongiae]